MVLGKKFFEFGIWRSFVAGRLWSGVAFAAVMVISPVMAVAQAPAAGPSEELPDRKSSLPREALLKAREAERHLAANAPEKAIEILRGLDRQYPGRAALSLRLGEIYDTMGKNAYALFFYRRYVAQAGDSARPMAVERVSSLELMAGVRQQVELVEREFGEDTQAVATPAPRVERMLATRAQDGGLVPIRNEEDLKKLEREGVPEKSPERRVVRPSVTPIVVPSELSRGTAPAATGQSMTPSVKASSLPGQAEPRRTPGSARQQSDEDALLAQAFRKRAEDETEPVVATPAIEETLAAGADLNISGVPEGAQASESLAELPPPVLSQNSNARTKISDAGGESPRRPAGTQSGRAPGVAAKSEVIYTSPTPVNAAGRSASFFNVSDVPGQFALVSLVHEVPASVLTVTITPKDDGEMVSAILVTGEQKRVYLRPGTFDVTVNLSTTDYSPITLMNTAFEYTFSAGKQYTRRFNKTNIQQLN